MKQSDAVYQATHQVLKEKGIKFEDGMNVKEFMNTDLRKAIIEIVTEGIFSGRVDFSEGAKAKYPTREDIRTKYVGGLVSNWHRKDERFNGGTKYVPAKPGSRTGQGDAEVKNLRLLLKSGKLNTEQSKLVQGRLDTRLAEISAAKAKSVDIDFSALPADLVEELGIETE